LGSTVVQASNAAPCFSAYATTTQSFVNAAQTKVTLAGEYFDTNNNFASSRFTPTVAGYYFITGSVTFNNLANNIGSFTHIYKNGSSIANSSASANAGVYSGLSISALTYLNGSTDYVELYATQAAGGLTKDTIISVINANDGVTFSGFLARSA
jgi:hypothetical protein